MVLEWITTELATTPLAPPDVEPATQELRARDAERQIVAAVPMAGRERQDAANQRGPVGEEIVREMREYARSSRGLALDVALRLVKRQSHNPRQHPPGLHQGLAGLVAGTRDWLRASVLAAGALSADPHVARRRAIQFDLAFAAFIGILMDGIAFDGFEAIDQVEFRTWLATHGAEQETLDSALTRAAYDLAFAFAEGDVTRPSVSAAVALRGLLRLLFTYRGAVMFKMKSGMGDAIFAPLYEVLRRRGVRFRFFHRVTGLHLGDPPGGASTIEQITLRRQANVIDDQDYSPFVVDRTGQQCWPNEPLYDQLVEGAALHSAGPEANLESAWSSWPGVGDVTLQAGQDFDDVVLGVSLGALPAICQDLVGARTEWQTMMEQVRTIRTQAFQVWARDSVTQLGWPVPLPGSEVPLVGGYVEPIDTYADMTHVLEHEAWPADDTPG